MRTHSVIAGVLACFLVLLSCLTPVSVGAAGASEEAVPTALTEVPRPDPFACRGAVLMEAETGSVLYEQNADEALPPASVTKIMTLLLVMEAIEGGSLGWEDTVTASAHAASMGGSQIFLKEGEQMTVRDLVKSVVIASANDAALALAEAVAGSEETFVGRMNARAAELGMKNTVFENTNGLDDTAQNHVISARDIAIMSRELIRHKEILTYSSTWMDSVRDGAFGLTNTNRLVRYYPGCNGLKTGSTAKAGFCVSVTAEREGMTLICVIMGAESRDSRNAAAAALLDWGFANYALYTCPVADLSPIRVTGGVQSQVGLHHAGFAYVLPRSEVSSVEVAVTLPDSVSAPVRAGEAVGQLTFTCQGAALGQVEVVATQSVERIGFWGLLQRLLARVLLI